MVSDVSEWQHEPVTRLHVIVGVVEIEGPDTCIAIPANLHDDFPEFRGIVKRVSEQGYLDERFSWRIVDHGVAGNELHLMIGEQRIDTTTGYRHNWTVMQRNCMRTFTY